MLSDYIREMRIKQWYKALVIFFGPFFAKMLTWDITALMFTFLAFGFIASSIYVINDLKDVESDKGHPRKKQRPIASGKISIHCARIFAISLFTLSMIFSYLVNISITYLVLAYFFLMIAYTFYLKKLTIIDAFIIALGFLIRAYAGCFAIGISITTWFYLLIFCFAVYLAFSKRFTELKLAGTEHKKSLEGYSGIIEIAIAISGAITLTLYAIYLTNTMPEIVWSFPFAFMGLISHLKETSKGKEVDEMLTNPELIISGIGFIVALFIGLY